MERTGQRLTEVLTRAYDFPFTIQSDFARSHADVVGVAASLGFLTTILPDGTPTREWRVTPRGLRFLLSQEISK